MIVDSSAIPLRYPVRIGETRRGFQILQVARIMIQASSRWKGSGD